MISFLFIVLFSRTHFSEACVYRQTERIAPPKAGHPEFCVREATLHTASAFRVLSNGTCELVEVCPGDTTTSGPLPLYKLLQPNSLIPLLRGRPDQSPHVFDLFSKGATNKLHTSVESLQDETDQFLSSLVVMKPCPISAIRLLLFRNSSREPVVKLRFRVEGGDDVRQGKWFSKDRLVASFPWNLTSVKEAKFGFDKSSRRKFFIFETLHCDQKGYMLVFSGDPRCNWEKKFVKNEFYAYVPNGPGQFSDESLVREAFEMRLIGELKESTYVRIQ